MIDVNPQKRNKLKIFKRKLKKNFLFCVFLEDKKYLKSQKEDLYFFAKKLKWKKFETHVHEFTLFRGKCEDLLEMSDSKMKVGRVKMKLVRIWHEYSRN